METFWSGKPVAIPKIGDYLIGLQRQSNGKYKNVRFPFVSNQLIGKKVLDLNTTETQEIGLFYEGDFIPTDILISKASAAPVNAGGLNFTTGANESGTYIAYGGINQSGADSPLKVLSDPDKTIMSVRKPNDSYEYLTDTGLTMFLTSTVIREKIYFTLDVPEGSPLTANVYLIGTKID
jgi:hypothetical protein